MQESYITVSFGKTTSPDLPIAVEISARLPGYCTQLEGKYTIHRVRVPTSAAIASRQVWDDLYALVIEAGNWKSTEVSLDGKTVSAWRSLVPIREVAQCYGKRQETSSGDDYCRGKSAPDSDSETFGCRLAGGVTRALGWGNGRLKWFQCGVLSDDLKSFHVDKEKIQTVLFDRTRILMCVHCPAFSWDRLREGVNSLPDIIDLAASETFEIKYSAVNPSQPLGIQTKQSKTLSLRLPLQFDDEEGKPEPQLTERNVPNVHFSDVAGMDEAIKEIKDVVQLPLTHAQYFASIGMTPHQGIILYGPPGNGKTLLVKAVATESNAHLEIINGPEILSKWVGQSEQNLRKVFARARVHQPSIVLIDELDALAAQRDAMNQQHEVTLISQLLVLLDGLEERGQVFVIGTTNRLDAVDPAIRRPGRFDYHIFVRSPDANGRGAILRVHLARMRTSQQLNLSRIVSQTDGWSGAELAALCREAGLIAIKQGIERGRTPEEVVLTQSDLDHAVTDIQTKRIIKPDDSSV